MPASYPTSAKVFTTKSEGPGNTILAAHINDLQLEVTAIENDLIAGLPVARGGTGLSGALAANRIPYSNGTIFTSAAGFTFDGSTLTAPATAITGTLSPAGLLDASGAAAGQIKFPAAQNASANANTLDDYEEGTWAPNDQSGAALSFATVEGQYVKIGQLVIAAATLTYPATGDASNALIGGLPFTCANTSNSLFGAFVNRSDETTLESIEVVLNTTTVRPFTNAGVQLVNSALSGNLVRFTAIYRATA